MRLVTIREFCALPQQQRDEFFAALDGQTIGVPAVGVLEGVETSVVRFAGDTSAVSVMWAKAMAFRPAERAGRTPLSVVRAREVAVADIRLNGGWA